MSDDETRASRAWRCVRVTAYVFIAAWALHAVVTATGAIDPPDDARYHALLGEDGLVEWSQAGLYALSGLALLAFGRGLRQRGTGLVFLAMLARELDRVLETRLGEDVAWWMHRGLALAGIVLVLIGVVRGAQRHPRFTSLAFTLLLIGGLTALGFAQLLGQRDAWESLIRPEYGSIGKRLAEEGLELLGAVWITLGVAEQVLFSSRSGSRHGEGERPVA